MNFIVNQQCDTLMNNLLRQLQMYCLYLGRIAQYHQIKSDEWKTSCDANW